MKKNYKAFTLAEIMIVLTVIGIISAIIMPIAFKSAPDQNILKFKKANSTLVTAVNEMLNAKIVENNEKVDKYYGANLGEKAERLGGGEVTEATFFCETFADMLVTKERKCINNATATVVTNIIAEDWEKPPIGNGHLTAVDSTAVDVADLMDKVCKKGQIIQEPPSKIITVDDVVYYELSRKQFPELPYINTYWKRGSVAPENYLPTKEDNYYLYVYKPFCMDVDGLNKGEDPFGYGIRIDGKVIPGKRAQEWINKSIQGNN